MLRIQPDYFLDEMGQDEISEIAKAKSKADRESWEQTRTLAFYTVISMQGSKNFKKPKDLFPLPWDKEVKKGCTGHNKPLTQEEATKRANLLIESRNNKM